MNGQTQLVGVLGWPVAHSKSPAMQNAAFQNLGLNWAYVPLCVTPHFSLEVAIKGLAACGFRGANVTVPYKEEALKICNTISDDAKKIGAVNTLLCAADGSVRGENTDAPGFLAHLAEEAVEIKGQKVAVVGAGGAARAIIFALLSGGAKEVMVINRNEARAQELARRFEVKAFGWTKEAFMQASQASLIVNTTSLGIRANDPIPWHPDVRFSRAQVVYDVIYKRTPFLDIAISQGARAITGAGMLLWQGAIAFKMWTDVEPPVDIMRRELQDA
jgi:shikimate dehydrogenase